MYIHVYSALALGKQKEKKGKVIHPTMARQTNIHDVYSKHVYTCTCVCGVLIIHVSLSLPRHLCLCDPEGWSGRIRGGDDSGSEEHCQDSDRWLCCPRNTAGQWGQLCLWG